MNSSSRGHLGDRGDPEIMSNLYRLPRHFVPRNDGFLRIIFVMTVVLLIDIFLQTYFRGIGYGVLNKGISFGWFSGLGTYFAIAIYLVFIKFSGLMNQTPTKPARINLAIWLLAVGGVGNLVPRLIWSGVWDYLYFPVLGFWFNLSDVLICVGVIIYLWSEIASCRARPCRSKSL